MSRRRKQSAPQPLYDLMQADIRLACLECDRDDMDGITAEQMAALTDWHAIHESPAGPDDMAAWQTHYGYCPECWIDMEGQP